MVNKRYNMNDQKKDMSNQKQYTQSETACKNQETASKCGRPSKKSYEPEALMQELIDAVVEVYKSTNEIKATAAELSFPPNKVKKLLITGKVISYTETAQLQNLIKQGKTMEEIQVIMNMCRSTINTYLPYSKVIYKLSEVSQNAERVERYKKRKQAVDEMKANCTEKNLWNCIIAFQDYPFYTASGLPFTYILKTGRNGEYTKELWVDRRENSKSLSWSSVRIAFEKAMEQEGTVFARPKEIADVRGISYSYSLLWRFGVITVPEDVAEKLQGKK